MRAALIFLWKRDTMRNRRWVLVVAIVGAVLVLGGYFSWRITRADDKFKALILAKVRPFLAQESDIQKVELDLSSLHLRGVKLAPKDHSFTLEIEDVRLNYTLFNLIRFRLAPYKITHEIVLFRPTIRIRKDRQRENDRLEEEWLDLPEVFRSIDHMKRITVVDAAFIIEDSMGHSIRIAHSMNGWLQSNPADSATVKLVGKVFESKTGNVTMEGKLNLLSGRPLWMHVLLKESESGNELPFLLPDYIQMTSGKIQGDVHYSEEEKLSGYLEIKDGSLVLQRAGLNIRQVYLKGIFEKTDLSIQGNVGNFNGSAFTISGRMENILDPHLDLKVESFRFSIPSFFNEIAPDYRLSLYGRAHVVFTVNGPLNSPIVKGRFTSTSLKTYGVVFDHFYTIIGLQNSKLTLKGHGGGKEDLALDLEGMVDFSDSARATSLDVKLQGNMIHFLPLWMKTRFAACSSDLHVQVHGGLRTLAGEAGGQFELSFREGGLFQLRPSLRYENQMLSAEIHSNESFHSNGTVWHPFQKDIRWTFQVDGMESLFRILVSEERQGYLSDLAFNGNYTGSSQDWEMRAQGFRKKQGEITEVFTTTLSPIKSQRRKRKLQLSATYFASGEETLSMLAQGSLSKRSLEIDGCSVGDFLFLKGEFPFHFEEPLSGSVYVSGLSLEKLHSLFPQTKPYFGLLQGKMEMSGTRKEPGLDLKLTLDKGKFHSVDELDGDLEYQLEDGALKKCDIHLTQGGIPIIHGTAERSGGDTLIGDFYGRDVNFGDLFLAVFGKTTVTGKGSFEIGVSGTPDMPVITGSVDVMNGSFGPHRFQQLTAALCDTISMRSGVREGILSIRRGQIDSEDGMKLLFWGDIAHDREKGSDISILAEGNVLGLLPEVNRFFKKAEGPGEIFLRWVGGQGEWVLGSGRIRLDGGTVELAHYLNRIEDIKAEAELEQGERFFHISQFSGTVDGERFSITNSGWDGYEKTYAPLVFENLGVHLGALQFSTEGKGIHIHLPGFMERGDKGWLSLRGKNAGESFIIAGPPESPLLRGAIGLTNIRLTYPFLEVEMDSADPVITFLSEVNWDIVVRPLKDVHYIRDILTPMGNVYTDLQILDGHGGINLQGVIQDNDFQVWGNLVSTEGSLEALDHFFRPERITFDYQKGARDPIIAGRAFTTVIDSLGMPATVWLNLASIDNSTGIEKSGGPWKKIQFRFSTDNPNLARNEADLMAALGYSSYYMKDRAYDALGLQLENMFIRPLIRPLEQGIRRHLGLDVVRFSSMFSRNIMQLQMGDRFGFDPLNLFRSARLTLGKYITRGIFITYSGKIHNTIGYQYPLAGVGFRHAFALEYTIRPDLFLEMEYTYDSQLLSDRREDKRIWLRHIFPF
jgi:hypothetical protein